MVPQIGQTIYWTTLRSGLISDTVVGIELLETVYYFEYYITYYRIKVKYNRFEKRKHVYNKNSYNEMIVREIIYKNEKPLNYFKGDLINEIGIVSTNLKIVHTFLKG